MRVSTIITATLLASISVSQAMAVVVEPEPVVIVEPEQNRSSYGILLPLLLVGGLVAAATSNDDS